jgi:hypothetical protein
MLTNAGALSSPRGHERFYTLMTYDYTHTDPLRRRTSGRKITVVVVMVSIAFALLIAMAYADRPPVSEKWVAYGGPQFTIDAELRGTVVLGGESTQSTNLLITPDPNYYHLLVEGNRRRPVRGEGGYEGYQRDIAPRVGNNPVPIIKCETYGVGLRPDSSPGSVLPTVNDNGQVRPVRAGDHIKLTGLYVIDYSHTMYWGEGHTKSFSYTRHAEIHPFNYRDIELIPPASQNSEVHLVGAPVYPEIYTFRRIGNIGKRGDFFEPAKQSTKVAQFIIPAPPRPSPDVEPRVVVSEVMEAGEGSALVASTPTDTGVKVIVTVRGSRASNPRIHRARYSVGWGPKTVVDPRCTELRRQIKAIAAEIEGLQADLGEAAPGQKAAIVRQIRRLQQQRAAAARQAQGLGCPAG